MARRRPRSRPGGAAKVKEEPDAWKEINFRPITYAMGAKARKIKSEATLVGENSVKSATLVAEADDVANTRTGKATALWAGSSLHLTGSSWTPTTLLPWVCSPLAPATTSVGASDGEAATPTSPSAKSFLPYSQLK